MENDTVPLIEPIPDDVPKCSYCNDPTLKFNIRLMCDHAICLRCLITPGLENYKCPTCQMHFTRPAQTAPVVFGGFAFRTMTAKEKSRLMRKITNILKTQWRLTVWKERRKRRRNPLTKMMYFVAEFVDICILSEDIPRLEQEMGILLLEIGHFPPEIAFLLGIIRRIKAVNHVISEVG
jgi:hypothetical protein